MTRIIIKECKEKNSEKTKKAYLDLKTNIGTVYVWDIELGITILEALEQGFSAFEVEMKEGSKYKEIQEIKSVDKVKPEELKEMEKTILYDPQDVSMAVSYVKDLVAQGKIEYSNMEAECDKWLDYMRRKKYGNNK